MTILKQALVLGTPEQLGVEVTGQQVPEGLHALLILVLISGEGIRPLDLEALPDIQEQRLPAPGLGMDIDRKSVV